MLGGPYSVTIAPKHAAANGWLGATLHWTAMTTYKDGFPAASPCSRYDGRARAALIMGAGYKALFIAINPTVMREAWVLAGQLGRKDIHFDNLHTIGDGHRHAGRNFGGIVVDPYIEGEALERIPFSYLRSCLRWNMKDPHYAGLAADAVYADEAQHLPKPIVESMADRRQRVLDLLEKRGHKALWGANTGTTNPGARLHIAGKIVEVHDEWFLRSNYEVVTRIVNAIGRTNAHEVATAKQELTAEQRLRRFDDTWWTDQL